MESISVITCGLFGLGLCLGPDRPRPSSPENSVGHNTMMSEERRLQVVKSCVGRPPVVLVRRDDKEHLLMLGPGSETVVERGIDRGARSDDDPASPRTPLP